MYAPPPRWCTGLLRELNPGPLTPEARIMPLDQAAVGWRPDGQPFRGEKGHTGNIMMCGSSMVLQARHTRASVPATHTNVAMLCVCALHACGLLRELNPGPLAPEARIMPQDQAANGDARETETQECFLQWEDSQAASD